MIMRRGMSPADAARSATSPSRRYWVRGLGTFAVHNTQTPMIFEEPEGHVRGDSGCFELQQRRNSLSDKHRARWKITRCA